MSTLFSRGNRVLILGAIIALLVVLYPPWAAEVNGGRADHGQVYNEIITQEFLGYALLLNPPAPNDPQCGMPEFSCWVDIAWIWLGLELLAVAALAGIGWLVDRPPPARRTA